MIKGGNATVFVANMDRAVTFYVDTLGLKLERRFGDHWAEVSAPSRLVIGLHPQTESSPMPGTSGSISIGFDIDEPIADVVNRLSAHGVQFRGPIMNDEQAGIALAFFGDADGNDLYLCEVLRRS